MCLLKVDECKFNNGAHISKVSGSEVRLSPYKTFLKRCFLRGLFEDVLSLSKFSRHGDRARSRRAAKQGRFSCRCRLVARLKRARGTLTIALVVRLRNKCSAWSISQRRHFASAPVLLAEFVALASMQK